MEEPVEQVGETRRQEPHSSAEDRYSQSVQDMTRAWQSSRQAVWELYQELHAHHSLVQTRYEAVVEAIRTGQELKPLLHEYHEAVIEHRLLVRLFRQAMQQHHQEMKNGLLRRVQQLQ